MVVVIAVVVDLVSRSIPFSGTPYLMTSVEQEEDAKMCS